MPVKRPRPKCRSASIRSVVQDKASPKKPLSPKSESKAGKRSGKDELQRLNLVHELSDGDISGSDAGYFSDEGYFSDVPLDHHREIRNPSKRDARLNAQEDNAASPAVDTRANAQINRARTDASSNASVMSSVASSHWMDGCSSRGPPLGVAWDTPVLYAGDACAFLLTGPDTSRTQAQWVSMDAAQRAAMAQAQAMSQRSSSRGSVAASTSVSRSNVAARPQGRRQRGIRRFSFDPNSRSHLDEVVFGKEGPIKREAPSLYSGHAGLFSSEATMRCLGAPDVESGDPVPAGAFINYSWQLDDGVRLRAPAGAACLADTPAAGARTARDRSLTGMARVPVASCRTDEGLVAGCVASSEFRMRCQEMRDRSGSVTERRHLDRVKLNYPWTGLNTRLFVATDKERNSCKASCVEGAKPRAQGRAHFPDRGVSALGILQLA